MAKLVGVFNTGHTPFCYMPPEDWNTIRSARPIREDVPMDTNESNREKFERIQKAFAVLREQIAEARPDVFVIFGDDQYECFNFTNFPTFAVYVGETFEGAVSSPEALLHDAFESVGMTRPGMEEAVHEGPPPRATVKGHPQFGTAILLGLMKRGFDPAFCMDMPNPEYGVGHAFLRPWETLTDKQTAVIPVLTNCYFAPQVTGARSAALGRALAEVIREDPSDLRVAVVGSGGLWHTPGQKGAYLDEAFDRASLALMEKGDIDGMARLFDDYKIPEGDTSQQSRGRGPASTGMPSSSGPLGGTREICNWIAAAAVAEGKPVRVIDYVPVYASPIGVGFASYIP
jgi:hypothetical protein